MLKEQIFTQPCSDALNLEKDTVKNNMDSVTLSFSAVINIEFTHKQLVAFFSAAELHRGEVFNVFVKDEYRELKYNGPGDCYEDYLVNTLVNGGSLCVADVENSYNKLVTLQEANKNKTSLVLNVVSIEEFKSRFYNDSYFAPVYEITLERISKAFQEILSGTTTCKDKDTEKCLMENYQNTFVNKSGDYFDAWNIFQYIVFGDVIYW